MEKRENNIPNANPFTESNLLPEVILLLFLSCNKHVSLSKREKEVIPRG